MTKYQDDYDDYEDNDGNYEEYNENYDTDNYTNDAQFTTEEFDLNQVKKRKKKAKPPLKINYKLLGGVGGGLVVLLLAVGALSFSGILGGGTAQPPTLIPTVEVVLPPTNTPLPPTATPTPTPAPAGATFISPANGTVAGVGQQLLLQVEVVDGQGITSIAIPNAGLAPRTYNGESLVTYDQIWAPENPGIFSLSVTVRNRLGQTTTLPGITVQVLDQAFLDQYQAVIAAVNQNTAALRGLPTLTQTINPSLLNNDGLRRYLRSMEIYTIDDGYNESLILSSFDLIPRGFNMYETTMAYLGANLPGFYDPQANIAVVVSSGNQFTAYEQYVHVHQVAHALQDANFTLTHLAADAGIYDDQTLAMRGFTEGEAKLLQEQYLATYLSANAANINAQAAQTSPAPSPFLSQAFLFAYDEGYNFVNTLYTQFGWAGVNEAWNNAPISTEQILHPDRYLAGELPKPVALQPLEAVLGSGWQHIYTGSWGEFLLRQFLAQRVEASTVDTAATGWGGDQYMVYAQSSTLGQQGKEQLVMVIRWSWDTAADSTEFASALTTYANSAYGSIVVTTEEGINCRIATEAICTYQIGEDWLLARAPLQDTAVKALQAQIQP